VTVISAYSPGIRTAQISINVTALGKPDEMNYIDLAVHDELQQFRYLGECPMRKPKTVQDPLGRLRAFAVQVSISDVYEQATNPVNFQKDVCMRRVSYNFRSSIVVFHCQCARVKGALLKQALAKNCT